MSGKQPGWVTLTQGETVVWSGGPSIASISGTLAWDAVLAIAGLLAAVRPGLFGPLSEPLASLGTIPLALTALAVAHAVLAVARWHALEYLVTSEELYLKRGLVSRSVKNLRIGQIQNTGFTQSATQRLLAYGTVYVSTAGSGGTELAFADVPDPEGINEIVTEQLDAFREREATSGS
jgi:uncharacterized membrane protein YdbT with pleckstrin-like domain